MTQQPYELLARFNDGSVSGVSVRYLFTVGNKIVEGDPEPLAGTTDPAFTAFAQQFSAAAVAERDQLASDKSTLENQVATLTGERDAALAQVTTLSIEKDTLTEANATLTAQLAAANARITALVEQVQFDPRVIEANAFLNRIASTELAQLFSSDDPSVKQISQMLLAYKANDWRIELDSTEMQQAVGYLQIIGMVTPERAAALLRDGTRAEAYIDDGSV